MLDHGADGNAKDKEDARPQKVRIDPQKEAIIAPPSDVERPEPTRAQKSDKERKERRRVMWILLGVVVIAYMVIGISYYVGKQRQQAEEERDKFVAEVGREPSLHGVTPEGETDLHIVVRLNLLALTRSLLSQGANIHAKNKHGDTPLHKAAMLNAHETVEVLLKHGADVNAKNKYDSTPLHYAVFKNAHEIAEVLLKHGADVNAKSNIDFTPLDYAKMENARETIQVLLKHGLSIK